MNISNEGVDFIARFEGFKSVPYLDAVGIATIGYGTITYPDTNKRVTLKDTPITKATALEYLRIHIELEIVRLLNIKLPGLSQNQFDALVSFCYNLGIGALSGSTLEAKIKAKAPCDQIKAAFLMWVKAGGRVLQGLVRRREAEADLFCNNKYK